jgi:hypothetical protein
MKAAFVPAKDVESLIADAEKSGLIKPEEMRCFYRLALRLLDKGHALQSVYAQLGNLINGE